MHETRTDNPLNLCCVKVLTFSRPPNKLQPAMVMTTPCTKATARMANAEVDSVKVENVRSNTQGMSKLKMRRLSSQDRALVKVHSRHLNLFDAQTIQTSAT
eukprot:4046189-Pyramimonas_sp.AAC.1